MQKLYFVRHGQTELNQAICVQGGGIDSPLLETSRAAARKTGLHLRDAGITRVISSPQGRALETAELIVSQFAAPLPIIKDARLRELEYGSWEGVPIPDFQRQDPETFYALRKCPDQYDPSPFGGETYEALIQRGRESIHEHATRHSGETLLFVGHSIHLMSTLLTLVGFPLSEIRSQEPLENTSVTTLLREGDKYKLDTWNYIDHLIFASEQEEMKSARLR